MNWIQISTLFILYSNQALAEPEKFELTFHDAETQALKTSNTLKAAVSDVQAARETADSGFDSLLPRLSFQASYTYLGTVPQISIGAFSVPFGTNNNYSFGPYLNYTLWDTFSGLRSYQSLSKIAEARDQDRNNAELQLLLGIRTAYTRVQLALEELRLVNGSRDLAKAQDLDISTRFRAGAASRLDIVTSSRQVLSYELQFKQKQADLSSALKDLIALLGTPGPKDVSHPGPPGVDQVTLVLELDALGATLVELGAKEISPPDDSQPQIRSIQLVAESAERAAASQSAKLLPVIQASASTTLTYPEGPIAVQYNQNTVALFLSVPLYLGDPTWHLAEEKRREAESAHYREDQLKIDIQRDFAKGREMLQSLREQRKLAAQDVAQSEEAAKLYYASYKAGKNNLLDVQTANTQALTAKVVAARIDAQILTQLITLKALSGKDITS